MIFATLLILVSESKVFASFDFLESISTASFVFQHNALPLNLSFSSFAKNDEVIGRKIREIDFTTSYNYPFGKSSLTFKFDGSARTENAANARTLNAGVLSILPINDFLRFTQDVNFEVQRLSGTVYTADNSGIDLSGELSIGREDRGLKIYHLLDKKRLISKNLDGVRYSLTLPDRGIKAIGRAEYEVSNYEITGLRDNSIRRGGELNLSAGKGKLEASVSARLWDYRYAISRTRDRTEGEISVATSSDFHIAGGTAHLGFSTGGEFSTYHTISLWEKRIHHEAMGSYSLRWYHASFRIRINRAFFPEAKPDDRDERIIESSVGLKGYPILNSLLDLELGVRQNDFVFVRSERSANTRTRKIYFIRTGYFYDQGVKIKGTGELAAYYTLYRFRESRDMLLRYIDMNLDMEKTFTTTTLRLALRQKLSDYGRYFEAVYYRRSRSSETWFSTEVLIHVREGFNLNLHMRNYVRVEMNGVFPESRVGLQLEGSALRVGFDSVVREGHKYLTFSLNFERGF